MYLWLHYLDRGISTGKGVILHWQHSISAKKNVAVGNLTQGIYRFDANKIYIFIRVAFLW
jgi:hypothetical protein